MTVFGGGYAEAYDALYADKDYGAECDLIERLISAQAAEPVRRVLDLGCGTGGHAIVLATRGYEVLGVDRSEEMLNVARRKARGAVAFRRADIRGLELQERFDLVLMMFAVIGYLGPDADVSAALATARRHLRPGGLLVFDAWYEPAVLAQRPAERVKAVDLPGRRLVRRSSGALDGERGVCIVRFHLVDEVGGERRELREEHTVRYFSKGALATLLSDAGFDLLSLRGFPDVDREPDETTWSVLVAARA